MRPTLKFPLIVLASFLIVPSARAATKDEYRAASVQGLREVTDFGRAKSTVQKVDRGSNDGKITIVGRGSITLISQLLLAGRPSNDAELLGLAKDLVLACNKAALDTYDTPKQESLEQIGFSLRELSLAVPQMKELKLLTGRDAERTDETLKKAADYWLKVMPDPNDGNLAQRYALGVASVCQLFPDDPRVPQWKAWAEKPFLHLLHYPDQKGLPGAKRRVLEMSGGKWNFVEDTTPFTAIHSADISEDSSAYQAATILCWMGIAKLIGREADTKTPEVEAFIDRFYQQLMPIGILPAYGDAEWGTGGAHQWIAIFEWAATTFHQARYRAAADGIFRYYTSRNIPLGDLSEAVNYADESITPEPAPRSSVFLQRVSGRGERVPDKVILRGHDAGGDTQPYVMLMATEAYGHSHAYAGSIAAYSAGGSVFLSSLGYDATTTPLHDAFLVRHPEGPFIRYFGDPKSTLLGKRLPDGLRLTSHLTADTKEVRSAEMQDDGKTAYGKVVCDYLTAWNPERDFNGHAFLHTRELALDKASGTLCVLDTIESKSDVKAAFGPVWHIQKVLASDAQGFLCQTDYQAKYDKTVYASKPRPVWIAMAGPADTKLNDTFWKFTARHGHSNLAQEHHLTAEWRGQVSVGQKLTFLTVFVPMPEGTTEPPSDLSLILENSQAGVKRGAFSYAFPSTK